MPIKPNRPIGKLSNPIGQSGNRVVGRSIGQSGKTRPIERHCPIGQSGFTTQSANRRKQSNRDPTTKYKNNTTFGNPDWQIGGEFARLEKNNKFQKTSQNSDWRLELCLGQEAWQAWNWIHISNRPIGQSANREPDWLARP